MSGVSQLDLAPIVHNRRPGPHPVSKLGLCKDHIQTYQHLIVQIDVPGVSGSIAGQFRQDAFDLLLLLQLQLPERIVGIYRGHGLHKIGGAGCGFFVDKSRYIIFTFTFHRHHIPTLANGNDRFTKELAVGWGGNHLLQAVPDFAGLNTHMAPDIRQSGRCVVGNFLLSTMIL